MTVALLFGGRSSEHTISCATAGGVLSAIDRDKYRVIPIGITRDGAFTLEEDRAEKFTLNPAAMPEVGDNGTRILWPESTASRELRVVDPDGGIRSLGEVDVVFPILHGAWGEDGTLQGMLELIGLPYVGDGVLASAVAMDKHFAKVVFAQAGIPVAPGVTVTARGWASDPEAAGAAIDALGWPVFVKPARAGSSVGVTRAESPAELPAAMATALAEDSKVLVEAAMVGREIECGVLGGRDGGAPRVSLAGEIVVTGRGFYDFDAKYLDAPGIDLVCPTELTAEQYASLADYAARAFEAVGGSGLARADFFLTEQGFVINELNTMPGFTPISMFPKCWLASGLSYPELIDELIQLGLEAVR
nr:D-alanine--D-alanine ligase family protein [Galbitalea soli]